MINSLVKIYKILAKCIFPFFWLFKQFLNLLSRWLTHALKKVWGPEGYVVIGFIVGCYIGLYAIIEAKYERDSNRALFERSNLMTLVNSGNRQVFVSAMKDFGRVQMYRALQEPQILKPWNWWNETYPNRDPLHSWAKSFLDICTPTACSLDDENRIDLNSTNFFRAKLSGINLKNADLSFANLQGVDLNNSDLSGSEFHFADLRNAIIDDANIDHTSFWEANLEGIDLSGMKIMSVYFEKSNLTNAKIINTKLYDSHLVNTKLNGVNLKNSALIGCCIAGANLRDSNLCGTDLSDTKLTYKFTKERGGRFVGYPIMDGAKYSNSTKFPPGFDPKKFLMVKVNE